MIDRSAVIRWRVAGPALLAGLLAFAQPGREPVRVAVFDQALLRWDREHPELVMADGYVLRFRGQTVERSVELPPPPARPVDAPRITATVRVQPVSSALDSRPVPNDPWNRLGRVAVLAPGPDGGKPMEVELVRFVTGFGAASVHEQDVTALAPLLHGRRTLRAFVSTYSEKPGWTISVTLDYSWEDTGYRRPTLARALFDREHLTAAAPRLSGTIRIPPALARPRVRVITTGHATDGAGGNEFVTSPHVLRIDGREVARWRPWSERGAGLR
ncbi:MAG: peptide-N-glycosidase F-related protein, partial [Planctomycetota bacterium]